MNINHFNELSASFHVVFQKNQHSPVEGVTMAPFVELLTTASVFESSQSFRSSTVFLDVLTVSPTLFNTTTPRPNTWTVVSSLFPTNSVIDEEPTRISSASVSSTQKVDTFATPTPIVRDSSSVIPEDDSEEPTMTIEKPSQEEVLYAETEAAEDVSESTDIPNRITEDPFRDSKDVKNLPNKEIESDPFIRKGTRKILDRSGGSKNSKKSMIVFNHKEEEIPKYPFAPNYKNQDELDLVLCSSVESKEV